MNKAIIVDLDGTLCNCDHRLHFVESELKLWKSFHDGLVDDKLNEWCRDLIESFRLNSHKLVLLTGRDESYRDATVKWLERHDIVFEELLMRKKGDSREDWIIKKEFFNDEISKKYNITLVVEDRLSVTKMWREINIPCLQCDWGDF